VVMTTSLPRSFPKKNERLEKNGRSLEIGDWSMRPSARSKMIFHFKRSMYDYWIKMRTNLDTDPNVVFIANKLGIDIFSLIGRLHKFWSWANSHASAAGSLHRTSAAWIDHFVSCQGFSDALISVGWLLVRRDFLILPQWDRHNGPPAQARAGEAIRKKIQRANGENSKKVGSDENVRTREEKRRVEKNIINTHTPTARARPPSLEEAVRAPRYQEWAKGRGEYFKRGEEGSQEMRIKGLIADP
jgi:hypothetical protein